MSTRQQQRQHERTLIKTGEAAVKAGLPTAARTADLAAVAALLTRILRDRTRPDRASEAAATIHGLNAASTRRTPGQAKLACVKGCALCCHGWVGASVPEILLLARSIRAGEKREPSAIRRILAAAEPLRGLTPAARYGAKLPCPLLVDQVCSQYRDRPAVCRQATSLELAGCEDEFEGRGRGEEIKVSAVYLAHARHARLPLLAALAACGLPGTIYELSEGLARALSTDDAEARWLTGEPVFSGVQTTSEPPDLLAKAEEIRRAMEPT